MKRKIIVVFLALALCLSLSVTTFATSDISFIVDEFDNLNEDDRIALNELASEIYEDHGIGLFFVFTEEEDLHNYDVDSLVGDIEHYYIMIENEDSWYSFSSGRGTSIDYVMEMELRDVYEVAETYYQGIEDFLRTGASYFPAGDDLPKEPTESNRSDYEESLVYDDADLLSDQEERSLNKKLLEISQEYEAQLVIVALESMDGGDIDAFVEFIYDSMGFGYGSKHDGVLLLVSMDPREYRILSNGFAADAIELDTIDAIGEAFVSYLSDGEYAEAFEIFADECAYYLDGHINGFPFDFGTNILIALGIGLIVGLIVVLILKGQLKSVRKQNQANVYVKPGSMQITVQNDLFLYHNVSRTKKASSGSSGSGSGGSRNVGGGSF